MNYQFNLPWIRHLVSSESKRENIKLETYEMKSDWNK